MRYFVTRNGLVKLIGVSDMGDGAMVGQNILTNCTMILDKRRELTREHVGALTNIGSKSCQTAHKTICNDLLNLGLIDENGEKTENGQKVLKQIKNIQ